MARKQKFDYFEAFAGQAKIAKEEAELLYETIQNFSTAAELKDAVDRAHELEHSGDQISHRIYKAVANEFLPPIDFEDIVELAQRLDDIMDFIEDVFQNFYILDIHFMHESAESFAKIIVESCDALNRAMDDFHNFKRSKQFRELIVEINDHEEQGDRLFMEAMRELYTKDADNPMRVLVWSQIFKSMEKCCDACEHVADAMNTVLLKNV